MFTTPDVKIHVLVRLQNDTWRKFQLLKSLARADHPLNSFSTGNLETLKTVPEAAGLNTHDLVVQFYHKHYSANLMKVVLYSKESLDTMEGWVTEKFSAVPNKDLPRPVFPSDPFGPTEVKKYLEVVPIRYVC
jgi:insulysin